MTTKAANITTEESNPIVTETPPDTPNTEADDEDEEDEPDNEE